MNRAFRRCNAALDRFLFDTCDPIICSLMRVALAVVLLIYVMAWMLEADIWFSDAGVLRSETVQQIGQHGYWSLLFWLPSTPTIAQGCLAILLVQSVLLLLGCWSRFQAICIFIWLTSFQHRNGLICDGQDVLIRLLIFYMIFMPLDHAWSLGQWLRGLRSAGGNFARAIPSAARSAWALRLVQFQITAIYLSTVCAKLQGQSWRNGTALYYVSRMDDLFGRFWLPESMFETAWMVKAMTWGVLGLEATLPLMLWFRPTRRFAVVAGIGLHLSIEYAMHLFLFEWIMIVGLLSFIKPSEFSRLRE